MRDSTRQKTNRDEILDATDKLLSQFGYKKMTIEDLAREVGIGKGSVYLHFESKEEIALSHIDRIIERLKARLWEIARRPGSCRERLVAMITERVLFRFDSVQHYSQSMNELLASLRSRLLERRKRYFGEEAKILAQLIEEGVRNGEFECDNALSAAETIVDATNSLLPYSLSAIELGERKEIEKKTKNVAAIVLNGLGKR